MPTIRQLEYLVAIDKFRHFGKAAEFCHVSQPTLSAQLQTLEDHLGTVLVERRRQEILLTEVGEQVVVYARQILEQVERLRQVAENTGEILSGKLILGVIPTVAPYYLPHILPHVQREYPNLKIIIKEVQTPELLKELEMGTIDVGLMALPASVAGTYKEEPLYEEDFVVATPKDSYGWSARVTAEDLRDQRLLLLDEGHCLRDQALDVCHWASMRQRGDEVDFRAASLETLKHMVVNGLGVTLLPQMSIDDYAQYAVRPLMDENAFRTIGLVWRRTSPKQKDYYALTECLKECRLGGARTIV